MPYRVHYVELPYVGLHYESDYPTREAAQAAIDKGVERNPNIHVLALVPVCPDCGKEGDACGCGMGAEGRCQ